MVAVKEKETSTKYVKVFFQKKYKQLSTMHNRPNAQSHNAFLSVSNGNVEAVASIFSYSSDLLLMYGY